MNYDAILLHILRDAHEGEDTTLIAVSTIIDFLRSARRESSQEQSVDYQDELRA